jgi:hypothetical protein
VAGPAAAASAAPLGSPFAHRARLWSGRERALVTTGRAQIQPRDRAPSRWEPHPVRSAPGFWAPFLVRTNPFAGAS